MSETVFYHHGIKGQRWGVRRYQNPDGSLTAAGYKHLQKQQEKLEKADQKWAKKNYSKITSQARKAANAELDYTARQIMSDKSNFKADGKLSAAATMTYNRAMASAMTRAASSIRSPSGQTVQFIAARGGVGVHMALASEGYNMNEFKNGIWGGKESGRIAYKKTYANKMEID